MLFRNQPYDRSTDRAQSGNTQSEWRAHESKVWLAVRSVRRARAKRRSPALGEGNHVVQFFRPGFKEATQIARRLADALLILD